MLQQAARLARLRAEAPPASPGVYTMMRKVQWFGQPCASFSCRLPKRNDSAHLVLPSHES